MPLHTYTCTKCNEVFELLVGMTAEESPLKCPACDSPDITRNAVNRLNAPNAYSFRGQKLEDIKMGF